MPVITSWTSNPTQTRRRGWPYLIILDKKVLFIKKMLIIKKKF